MIRAFLAILMLATLAGCSVLKGPTEPVPPLAWLSPADGPHPALLKQKLTLSAHGQQKEMIAITRLTASAVTMAGLTPTGQTLVQIRYDANGFASTPAASPQLPSDAILSLLQWALWPEHALYDAYPANSGWAVMIDKGSRNLSYQGQAILRMRQIDAERIEIDHLSAGYTVRIEPLESSQ